MRLKNHAMVSPQPEHEKVLRKKLGGLLKHRGQGSIEMNVRNGVAHAWKECSVPEKDAVDKVFEERQEA